MKKNEKQVNVTLNTDVYDKMKIQAIKDGMTIKRWIEFVLLDYVKDRYEPQEPTRVYTSKDVSMFLQLEISTVQKWIKNGKLKAVKYGNEYYITREDMKKFLETRKKEGK